MNRSFILANTEELHGKIAEMSERIRQLEEALAYLHSSSSSEAHPLLRPELLRIKLSAEIHRAQMTSPKSSSSSTTDERENEPTSPFQHPSFPYPVSEQPCNSPATSIHVSCLYLKSHYLFRYLNFNIAQTKAIFSLLLGRWYILQ